MAAGAGDNWAVTDSQEAGCIPAAMAIPGATDDAHCSDPRNRHPWQKVTLGMQPEGKQIPLSLVWPRR